MNKYFLFTCLLFCTSSMCFSQDFINPYVESSSESSVSISKITIEKKRIVVYLSIKNTSTSDNYQFTLPGTDMKEAHYLYDPKSERKYLQKFSFGSDVFCCQSTRFFISPLSVRVVKLIFNKLDEGIKSFDINQGSSSAKYNPWSFKGVKLMSEAEVLYYKNQKKAEADSLEEQKRQETQKRKIAEEKERAENAKNRVESEKKASLDKVNAEKNQIVKYQQNTTAQTVNSIEYDGTYLDNQGKFIFLKPATNYLGRFGRCVGGISDFDLFRLIFLPNLNNCVAVNAKLKKIVLLNQDKAGDFIFSELIDFSKAYGMCVWNLTTNQQQSFGGSAPVYIPKITGIDGKNYETIDIQRKTISNQKMEIYIQEGLKSGKFYVLFNKTTIKYYIFYVQ